MKDEFERIVATIDVPMFVVTAGDRDEQDGCLVGFATQCSINPPRFLVCLSNKNRTTRIARRAAGLVVHVLRADQRDLAELFGGETGDEVDKLARVKWRAGPHGAPVLEGCDWFAGAVLARHELGDHDGFLVHVDAAEDAAARDEQLGYKAVRDLDPGHDA